MAFQKNDKYQQGQGVSGAGGSGGFANLRDAVASENARVNGSGYEWQKRALPKSEARREELEAASGEKDGRKRGGRDSWNGEDYREATDVERILAGLSDAAGDFQVDAGNDFGRNLMAATVGSVISPFTSAMSFGAKAYEGITGSPITERNEEGDVADYRMDSNQKAASLANAGVDVAGLFFGGSKEMLQGAGRAAKSSWARATGNDDMLKSVASAASDAVGKPFGRRVASSMVEEGAEEGFQQWLEDVRYDNIDEGTLGRMAEAGAWGAVGGATMTGVGEAMNRLAGGRRTNQDAGNGPDDTEISGNPDYSAFLRPADQLGKIDTDIAAVADKRREEEKYAPASSAYKVVQGYAGLKPHETVAGTDGLRKMYANHADDMVRAFETAGVEGFDRSKLDAMFADQDDVRLANAWNDMIANGAKFDVYDKRDPHTSPNSVMKFRLAEVRPGNALAVNTMVPQLNGGDVDGDMMGFFLDPESMRRARYATASMIGDRKLPDPKTGLDGRYGQVYADKDYIGFSLDSALNGGEYLDENGDSPIKRAFDKTFGDMTTADGSLASEAYRSRLESAWNPTEFQKADGIDGYKEFLTQLSYMRKDLIGLLKERGAGDDAYDTVDVDYMSELIYNLQQETGTYVKLSKSIEAPAKAFSRRVVDAARLSADAAPAIKGTPGSYRNITNVMTAMDVVNMMFEASGNTGLRFKQNMYWRSTADKVISGELDKINVSSDNIDTFVANIMHLMATDATPRHQVEGMFKGLVYRDVYNATFRRSKIGDSDFDVAAFKKSFTEIYNTYVGIFHEAMKREGIDGEFTWTNSHGKAAIIGDNADRIMYQAMVDVMWNADARSILSDVDDMTATFGDYMVEASRENKGTTYFNVLDYAGQETKDFFKNLVMNINSKDASRSDRFVRMIEETEPKFDFSYDADGRVVIDKANEQYANSYWEFLKQAIGVDVCFDFGIINMRTAAASFWGPKLFSRNSSDRLMAVTSLRMTSKYSLFAKNIDEAHRALARYDEATDAAEKANAKEEADRYRIKALAAARQNIGVSKLDDAIAMSITRAIDDPDWDGSDDGSDLLMALHGMEASFDEWSSWYSDAQATGSFGYRERFMDAVYRTAEDELNASVFSNALTEMNRTANIVGTNNMEFARKQADDVISVIKDEQYSAESVSDAISQMLLESSQEINVDMYASVIIDAGSVDKRHVNKGQSTANEAMLYQAVSKIYDTGAKSALNRITGSTLASGELRDVANSRRIMMSALSDPDFSWTVNANDGDEQFTVNRDNMFKAVGRNLNGSDPTIDDWAAMFEQFPQIVTWMGPSTFTPVQNSDAVNETQISPVANTLKRIISNANDYRSRFERNKIRNEIVNNPNNMLVILGIMGAKYRGESFSSLIENPREFRNAFSRALDELTRYHQSLLAKRGATDVESLASQIEATVDDMLHDQTDRLVGLYRSISRLMESKGDLPISSTNSLVFDHMAINQFCREMIDRIQNGPSSTGNDLDMAYEESKKALEALGMEVISDDKIDQSISAVGSEKFSKVDSKMQLDSIIYYLSHGKDNRLVKSVNDYPEQEMEFKNALREKLTSNGDMTVEDFESRYSEARREIVQEHVNVPTIPFFGNFTTDEDLDFDSLDFSKAVDKIANILSSGEYRKFDNRPIDEIKAEIDTDLMKAFGDKGRKGVEKIVNRYNGLVLSKLISDIEFRDTPGFNELYYQAAKDAQDQILTMESKLARSGISVSSAPSDVQTPTIDFTNKSIGVLADFAISSLESAGNSLMSGIEGGEYQQLIGLGAYGGGVDAKVPPRLITLSELSKMISDGDPAVIGATYSTETVSPENMAAAIKSGAVPDKSTFVGGLTMRKLQRLTDGEPSTGVYVYVMDDVPFPDDAHMKMTTRGGNSSYLPQMLVQMVYNRSEPGVFKLKKNIGKFDRIVREIDSDSELGRGNIFPADGVGTADSASIVQLVKEHRRKIAKTYYDGFAAEDMTSDFGQYDAMLISQMTTPAVMVGFSDGSEKAISMSQVWTQQSLDEKLATLGKSVQDISHVRVIHMPFSTVCKRINKNIALKMREYYREGTVKKNIKLKDLASCITESMSNFDDFRDTGADGVRNMMFTVPVMKMSPAETKIELSISPTETARFMNEVDGMGRGIPGRSSGSQIASSRPMTMERSQAISDLGNLMKSAGYDADKNGYVSYVRIGSDVNASGDPERNMLSAMSNKELRSGIEPTVYKDNSCVVLAIQDSPDAYMKIYRQAAKSNLKILMPASDVSSTDIPVETYHSSGSDFDMFDKRFVIVNPALANRAGTYDGPVPDIFSYDQADLDVLIGIDSLSDSASLQNPKFDRKLSVQLKAEMPRSVIFGGYRSMSNSPIIMPDASDIDDFRKQFMGRDGDGSRFVYPKFPDGNQKMSTEEIDAAVSRYLEKIGDGNTGFGNPAFITENVRLGDCIGFVKGVPRGSLTGDYVYSPIIINKGGVPHDIGRINVTVPRDDASSIRFMISGNMSPTTLDALKITFPTLAYKSYTRVATDEDWKKWGVDLTDSFAANGAMINAVYNGSTEEGRLTGNEKHVVTENLVNGLQLINGGLFWTVDDAGNPVIDYAKARRHINVSGRPANDRQIDELLNIHTFGSIWNNVINGQVDIATAGVDGLTQEDAMAINNAIRKFAYAVREINMSPGRRDMQISPAAFLSSFSMENVNGERKAFVSHVGVNYHQMLFRRMSGPNEALKLFHFIDERLCPNGYNDDSSDMQTLLNKDGMILVRDQRLDKPVYMPGHIQLTRYKHDSTDTGIASGKGAIGDQQVTNQVLDRGFAGPNEIAKAVDIMSMMYGDYSPYMVGGVYYKKKASDIDPFIEDPSEVVTDMSAIDTRYDDKLNREGNLTFGRQLKIIDNKYDRNILSPQSDELVSAYARFSRIFQFDIDVDPLLLHNIFKLATGYSYNEGDGSDTVTIDQFNKAITAIERELESGKGYFIKGGVVNGRITIPLGPRSLMRFIYRHSQKIRENADLTYDSFVEAAANEMKSSMDAVNRIYDGRSDGAAKKIAINRIIEYCYRNNGMGSRGPSLYGDYSIDQFVDTFRGIAGIINKGDRTVLRDYDRMADEMRPKFELAKRRAAEENMDVLSIGGAPNGWVASWFGKRKGAAEIIPEQMMMLSRTMSMLNPMLIPSSVAARAKGLGTMKAMMFLENGRRDYVIKNQSNLRKACRSDAAKEIWDAFNDLSMNADDLEAIITLGSPQAIAEYMRDYRARAGKSGKISRKVFRTMTAAGIGTPQQIEIFLNRFAQTLPPESIWLQVNDKTGLTYLEERIFQDPAGALVDILTTKNETTDFILARRARNLALECDFAQQTSVNIIFKEMFRNHAWAEMGLVTNFMRFPQYVFNSNGWFLQHVLPVSSIYYWTTDKLVKKAYSENPKFLGMDLSNVALDLEASQRFNSLKEAVHHDAMNLGMSAIAMLVLQLLDIEPPEDDEGNPDEAYMGQLNEWTILGGRIDDIWWLQDVIGPGLALAAFAKSVAIGKPRIDLLGNWFGQAMWNNPVLRASDIVTSLFAPQEGFTDGLVEESELYADAKGGVPGALPIWQQGLLTYGCNWASQFVTPSILKELYRSISEYEVSSKRVYATDANGNIVLDKYGQPYTVVTSGYDQALRQVSKSNPFLAVLLNVFSGSDTGYSRVGFLNEAFGKEDMPLTVYYQQDQLASVSYFSLYYTDDEGIEQAKSPEEINLIATEIIDILDRSDDMEELASTGFTLPYDTKEYVSKLIWDNIHYLDTLWSEWVENEAYDFTVLGEGDFGLGRQMYEDAKQAYKDDRRHFEDLYEKLWDDALGGIQKYNRVNTTYQEDAYGNIYATGFRRGPLGINTAPGTRTDPEGTLGLNGNWETPAVTNPSISAGGRGLVPVDSLYDDKPALDSWSEDGGYSDMAALTVGSLKDNEFKPNSSSDRKSYGRTYGYYRRGGGGGGGGYSPNLYSRVPSVSMPYSGRMYAERIYNPNYDYLRPNFETKGSREAYKRSDI